MNIAFWDNQLCERGTTANTFHYAYYNQTILKNKSFVFYDKNNENNQQPIIENFKKHFVVHETDNFKEVDDFLRFYKITHIYITKYGYKDHCVSTVAKNLIHCVFSCAQPHGYIYSAISPFLDCYQTRYPVIPYIVCLPEHDRDMRQELNIPADAIVFGGYGGKDRFSIPFAQQVVYNVAKSNPHIYFLFANFDRFCPPLQNIIHLPTIFDPEEKTRFINTTDAMIWARHDGETFGLAIGEFSIKNRPIIAMNIGYPCHVRILGDQAFWYNDAQSLQNILLRFNPEVEKTKSWNAYEKFSPENVMRAFEAFYLK